MAGLLVGLTVFLTIVTVGATMIGFVSPGRKLIRDRGKPHTHSTLKRIELNLDQFPEFDDEGQRLEWPSEAAHTDAKFEALPWPSTSWDDSHFGKTLGPEQLAEVAAARTKRERNAPPPKKTKKKAKKRASPPQDVGTTTRRDMANAVQREAVNLQEDLEQEFFEAKERASSAVKAATGLEPARVQGLVREKGLAGAVEQIRRETGWDFKKAAQFVAKTLRG